jgi:MFS family permease
MISLLGSNLTVVAVPYQVYSQTHSSLWVGLASLIQLPFLITGALWGGAMGDRVDKRVLMIVSAIVMGLTSAGLAINAHVHDRHLVVLLLLAALSAGFAGFSGPLRTAAIPKLVPPDELVAAYSLNQVSFNSAVVIGPAAAGVLISAVGLYSCYAIDATTFGLLTVLTWFLSPLPAAAEHVGTAMFRAISDGFRYVRAHAVVQAV